MVHAGYDRVWFGILLVLLIQTAMISPPFGINLFVIHGLRGRGTLSDVEIGSAPFVIALLIMIGLTFAVPAFVICAPPVFGLTLAERLLTVAGATTRPHPGPA